MAFLVPAIFLSLAWLTADHFPPWISWHNEVWAFTAVMWSLGWLLFFKIGRKNHAVRFPVAGWPLLLLAVVVLIQTAEGYITFVGDGWILLFYLMLCSGAMVLGYMIGSSQIPAAQVEGAAPSPISYFAMLVLLSGVCSVVVALAQALDVWETVNWIHRMPGPRRPGANLGQTNQLATFILFAIASLVYLFELRRLSVITASLMAVVLLLGLAITESRTGVLSLLFMAGWWMLKHRRIGFVLSTHALALGLAFFACCFWFWPSLLSLIFIDGHGATQVNLQAGTRLQVWPQLWQAVLQRPWFGWGLGGGVSEALNSVLHVYAQSENFTYAHNIVLDLAVGVGLPLTLLLLVLTGAWLWRRARASSDLLTWYCLAVALPFGVHSMLEFPFAYAYLLVPVMFLLGILEANLAQTHAVRIQWWPATMTWALASAAMFWSAFEYIAVEEDFRVARFEILNVGQTPGDYEHPRIILLTQMDALLKGVRLVPTPSMTPQYIELARKVAMRFPGPPTQSRYAVSLALNGNHDEALRQLLVMRAMYDEKTYAKIKENWVSLAQNKYPQLGELTLP